MVYFKKLRYKNFLSTGNQFTEIHLDKSPTTLVVGTNGAGKSTMLDALTFALFGKPFRNVNKPTLVNSINDKDLVTEVEFRIGTKEYLIRRGVKPIFFEIFCDGTLQDQDAKTKDYQDYLEKNILKFNYRAFTQIVTLGSSSFVPFMQLPAAERRTIIEDLLDIKIFSSMNVIVKTKLADIKTDLLDLKRNMDNTISQIDIQKKHIEDAKKNNTEQVEKKQIELEQNKAHVQDLTKSIKGIQKHIEQLLNKVEDETDINKKLKKLHEFENKIENNKSKTQRHLDMYQKYDSCPTCMQEIDKEFKDKAIHDCEKKIGEFEVGVEKLIKEQDALNTKLIEFKELHKNINAHNNEITRINASIAQIHKYIGKIQEEINELSSKKVLSDDMMKISETLVANLSAFNDRKKEIQDSKAYYELAATLLKDNGIKARIIKQYLPIINKLVNKYLAVMNFFVNFEINEEFKETIKSRHRDLFSYENFSEGEKMRIDLALLFTWRSVAKIKNSMNTNLLILDEVFDSSLDNSGTEEFLQLLNSFGSDTNVFVISHKGDILIDKFNSVIKFDKIKNFSQIV